MVLRIKHNTKNVINIIFYSVFQKILYCTSALVKINLIVDASSFSVIALFSIVKCIDFILDVLGWVVLPICEIFRTRKKKNYLTIIQKQKIFIIIKIR